MPAALPRPFNPELPTDYRGRQIRDTEDFERNQFVRRGATTDASGAVKVPRSWKTSLANAGIGALRGIATTGSLGGAVGGALAGGVGATISPMAGRENLFSAFQAPGIRESIAKRREQEEQERQAAAEALKTQAALADIELKRSQAYKNRLPPLSKPPKAPSPAWRQVVGPDGAPILVDMNAPGSQGQTFTPYVKPTEPKPEKPINAPAAAYKQAAEANKLKSQAAELWRKWGEVADPEEKERLRQQASAAQGKYNDAVRSLGELFPEHFEVGGFEEAPGKQGWAYYKSRRPQAQPLSRPGGSQAPLQSVRKGSVGQEFIQHVAERLKITPEEARRRIEADGYTIK
jgi:hypothetical protein